MILRSVVYQAIDSERDYQDRLWPQDGSTGFPNPLTIGEQILLAEAYIAQARLVWAKEKKPEMLALNIIRKVAGICVNCMEQHGAPFREDLFKE